jgi:hypothetical protein
MLARGARPDAYQIWTNEQWLIYDAEQAVDLDGVND